MPRTPPRHDHDAGGPAGVLAAKAGLRDEVWSAMRAARVARFPGAAGRIPNFTGAEAAAGRLRGLPQWQQAGTLKANPDSAQLPVRQRALEDGKTVYMAVPRLARPEPFFALDPAHLAEPPRKAASISGAERSARRVTLAEVGPVDLVVIGCVAAGEDGARLGKGGGFADLEYALAAAGLIGPGTAALWGAGEAAAAAALGHQLSALSVALFAEPNPSVIKAVLHAQGRIATPAVRPPLLPARSGTTATALRCAQQIPGLPAAA